MFRAGHPSTTTRLVVTTALLLAAAVGATQRGSVADTTTGCGSDAPVVSVRLTDAVGGFWWQHALYNVSDASVTGGGGLLDHLEVPLPTSLAAGEYDITVTTMDDHSFGLLPDLARHEQVVVSLEPPPTIGLRTAPSQDLPDFVERIESPVGALTFDHVVDTVYVLHRSIVEPATSNGQPFGNSIVPEEITFTCRPAVPTTTTTTTTSVPATTTTVVPSTTVPPGPLPATDGSEVENQLLRGSTPVVADVPSAPAAVETQFVPTYTG